MSQSRSGRRSFNRVTGRRVLCWRQQQIGRHAEARAQPLDHRHAQSLLAAQDFADAAWGSQDRGHVGAGEAVLVHQAPDQFRDARRPAKPFALLVGGNQALESRVLSELPLLIRHAR